MFDDNSDLLNCLAEVMEILESDNEIEILEIYRGHADRVIVLMKNGKVQKDTWFNGAVGSHPLGHFKEKIRTLRKNSPEWERIKKN